MIFRLGRGLQAAALALAVSCGAERASAPSLPSSTLPAVRLCHVGGSGAAIVTVPHDDVAMHVAHGDYLVGYTVGGPVGDSTRFDKVESALGAIRAGRLARGESTSAGCRITITVAAGAIRGTTKETTDSTLEHFPLVVDVPAITLRGAFVMQFDAKGRATGTGSAGVATTFTPIEPLPIVGGDTPQLGSSTPIILVNGHPGGSAANGLIVSGFIFQSGHGADDTVAGGKGVLALRVTNLEIRGNRFETGFTEPIDLRAGIGFVDGNQLGGVSSSGTCDVCIAGPGDFTIVNNRILAGGIPGILSVPAVLLPVPPGVEQTVLPAASTITAEVANNEVRDHLRVPVGVGVRVGTVGINAPNVVGSSRMNVHDNSLIHNNFAVIVEAAFPVANTALRGDADVTLTNNELQGSCQTNLLVSFSRHTTALGLSNVPYLKNSAYRLTLNGNVDWKDAWFSDPDGLGNTLTVDGAAVPNGARQQYDASKTC